MLDLLLRIEEDSGYSHLLIDNEIKKRHISSKDQGLLTEVVYGTMERIQTIDYYLEPFITNDKRLDNWVRMILRMSIYQMIFLDKVPDYAIINESVEITKQRGHKGVASLVNGVLRSVQRKGVRNTSLIEDNVKRLAVQTSHPEWLIERWINFYGQEITEQMCETNLIQKPISVRVQPLKISREDAMSLLVKQGYEVSSSDFSDQGIIINKGNILHSSLFEEGFLTVQDQSSMLASEMLDVKADMNVLDACSAPGGKVTHLAEKMENKGLINAYDLHKKKAKSIIAKAEKLDLTIIDAKHGDARKLQELHANETFDRILVDAPCSGLGVIRSKPDIKYNKTLEDIDRLSGIQQDILESVAPLLKKNGLLLYSTCTVDKDENEENVEMFLANHLDFEIDEQFFETLPEAMKNANGISEYGLQLFPQDFNTDGFFMARFIKK